MKSEFWSFTPFHLHWRNFNYIRKRKYGKGCVFIAAPDIKLVDKNVKDHQSWLSSTVSLPDLNEDDLVADFDDPSFKEFVKCSSNPENGFSSYKG